MDGVVEGGEGEWFVEDVGDVEDVGGVEINFVYEVVD